MPPLEITTFVSFPIFLEGKKVISNVSRIELGILEKKKEMVDWGDLFQIETFKALS